jgi:arylsulfate sulfotransferase
LTGSFQLALWDNGNDRVVDDAGDTCSPSGTPCYSTAAIFNVDETNMTASRAWSYQTPFSYWGGSVQLLANNNVLFDETAPSDIQGSRSIETTQQANPPIIWTLTTPLVEPMYRVKLIPSLYPQQP